MTWRVERLSYIVNLTQCFFLPVPCSLLSEFDGTLSGLKFMQNTIEPQLKRIFVQVHHAILSRLSVNSWVTFSMTDLNGRKHWDCENSRIKPIILPLYRLFYFQDLTDMAATCSRNNKWSVRICPFRSQNPIKIAISGTELIKPIAMQISNQLNLSRVYWISRTLEDFRPCMSTFWSARTRNHPWVNKYWSRVTEVPHFHR